MLSFLPATPRSNEGALSAPYLSPTRVPSGKFRSNTHRCAPIRIKLVSLALASLLLVAHLFAGESSPIVKFAVAPKYPTLPLEGRIYGDVTVRVTVDREGSVKDATVTGGHPMLREAAIDAAQQWKFQAGSASKRVATLKFSFVLLPENSEVKSQTVFLPPTGIEIRQKPAEPLVQDQQTDFTPVDHPISTI